MRQRWHIAVLAALALAPDAAHGQATAILDIGTAHAKYGDSLDATAISLAPALRIVGTRGFFKASGTFSKLEDAFSNSGILDGAFDVPLSGVLSTEFEATAGGSLHSDGARTGQLLGIARVRLERPSYGTWFGGGAGTTWDGFWRGMFQGEAGGWLAGNQGSASISVAPTVVDDTIRYTDASLVLHRGMESWDIDATFGVRRGSRLPSLPGNPTSWGSVSVTFWLQTALGLVASAGTYPVDFTQGFPGGQYISLGIRLAPRRVPASAAPVRYLIGPRLPEIRAFNLRSLGGEQFVIRIFAPRARTVEVIGDFTQWAPLSLTSAENGWWTRTVLLTTGAYQMNVRIDGNPWTVPPGLNSLIDEFGGTVGLLVVR